MPKLIIAAGFVLAVVGFWQADALRVIIVRGDSMRPGLSDGDILVCRRGESLRRGDVVLFDGPKGSTMLKRVIAVGNDTITYANRRLTINGVLALKQETGRLGPADLGDVLSSEVVGGSEFLIEESFGYSAPSTAVVGEGMLFVLGDNRDRSTDSRHFGLVPIHRTLCRATVRIGRDAVEGLVFHAPAWVT